MRNSSRNICQLHCKKMQIHIVAIFMAFGVFICADTYPQTKTIATGDPCSNPRFQERSGDVITVNATDLRQLPHCLNGKLVRVKGAYQQSFERSVLFDPTDDSNSQTWVSFAPFYPVAKRCSSPEALRLLNREKSSENIIKTKDIFGFVAIGIFRSGDRYGHMIGWTSELQVLCLEKLIVLSDSELIGEQQAPKIRKRISDWYFKNS